MRESREPIQRIGVVQQQLAPGQSMLCWEVRQVKYVHLILVLVDWTAPTRSHQADAKTRTWRRKTTHEDTCGAIKAQWRAHCKDCVEIEYYHP